MGQTTNLNCNWLKLGLVCRGTLQHGTGKKVFWPIFPENMDTQNMAMEMNMCFFSKNPAFLANHVKISMVYSS